MVSCVVERYSPSQARLAPRPPCRTQAFPRMMARFRNHSGFLRSNLEPDPQTRPRHRRRRLPRLASLRGAADAGPRRALRRQLLHGPQGQHRRIYWRSAFRGDAPRRDVPALRRGRRDLQSRLPGLADPLPVRSGADDQDQRASARSTCSASPSACGRRSCRRRPARCTATRPCTRRRRATGATSIRSVRAPATTKASAAPRRCSSTTAASTSVRIKVARIFNTYGPRMHPNDGRVVSNFIVQALRGEAITIYGDGSQTRSFCYVDDLIEGSPETDGDRRTTSPGPLNLGNPEEIPVRALAEQIIELTNSRSRIVHRPLPRGRSRSSVAPTSARPGRFSAGRRACRSNAACAARSPISNSCSRARWRPRDGDQRQFPRIVSVSAASICWLNRS